MRDDKREDPEILAHLEAENSYTEQQLKHTESLQSQLFDEIKGRIVKDDQSVPVKKGDYFYGSEVNGNNEYRIYTRAKDLAGNNKEVLLDVNELAKNHDYFSISGLSASPDNKLLAYGENTVSRRIYTIRIKNLETGEYLKDEIKDTEGGVVLFGVITTSFSTTLKKIHKPCLVTKFIDIFLAQNKAKMS